MPLARRTAVAAVLAALAAATVPPGAGASPPVLPPQRPVVAFAPKPLSQPRYGTQPPDADPATQRARVEAHDGIDLYVETWLPAEKDGNTPPAKVPTILIMTPYVSQGVEEYPGNEAAEVPNFIEYMTARGYAVAQHHVRGTGESGGCLEQTATNQIDDGARIVEYLGKDAPWTDGNVGMYGISYDAETQISVAGFGDPEKISYLKAIVPAASVGGQYEYSFFDGVPYAGQAALSNSSYLAGVSAMPGAETTPAQMVEKLTCQPEVMTSSADQSGDMTPFWMAREYRPGAPDVKAATLYVHGLADFNVQPITIAGWFDELPASTPHKGLFGVWNHAFPDRHGAVQPDWERGDWLPMVTAWFDRYLKGLPTGVESWPDVQVQASTGEWRAEPEFPSAGGPVGQLALGPSGTLGVTDPSGSTAYREVPDSDLAAGSAVFETEPLDAPLHLVGQPVLDLWLRTDLPDGHLAVVVQAFGPEGEVLEHDGSSQEAHATYGFRSLRHLEPIENGWFRQERGVDPPLNTPIRVPVRFHPTDLVVPEGGTLRVTVSGTVSYSRISEPSGVPATITLLHDCEHPSALRFLTPAPDAPILDVAEKNGEIATAPDGLFIRPRDGGIASAPVCGKAPERLASFGPARPRWQPPGAAEAPPAPPAPEPEPGREPPRAALPRKPLPATGLDFSPLALVVAGLALAVRRRRRNV